MTKTTPPVTIVGAGIAGAACARVLHDAGIAFRFVDRGRAVGGRMASPQLHGRRVDIGAGYFTVRDPDFAEVVAGWESAGLAAQWTDTFGVLTVGSAPDSSSGPMRWSTAGGLRSLVRAILKDIPVESEHLEARPSGDVVLAMPDPQAQTLTTVLDAVAYDPVVTVVCGFDELRLPFEHAAFVNDHPVVEFLADDGDRRGDGAPVFVVHTAAAFARQHLTNPPGAVTPVVAAVRDLLNVSEPSWTHVHRWTFAKPVGAHDATFGTLESDTGRTHFAGDQWCPRGSPRIESAWRSGTDLGHALVRRAR